MTVGHIEGSRQNRLLRYGLFIKFITMKKMHKNDEIYVFYE